MLSKTRFFFTQNSMVMSALSRARVSRLSIAQRPSLKFSHLLTNISFRKSMSAVPLKTVDSSIQHSFFGSKQRSSRIISDKVVGYWLIGTSGLVFGIVVLGGLTRLTESGLSITEWRPVTGSLPPMSEDAWVSEFNKYQESPEFKQLNSHLTLEEFKFIYSMEWGHRLVGRCIGLFFVLPGLYFWKRGKMGQGIPTKTLGLTLLLGLQGFIGWWMVKSGLDEQQLSERNSKPTVSQYRLTAHLGAAFLMYLGVLWTGFEILNENKWLRQAKQGISMTKLFEQLNNPKLKKIRGLSLGLLGLTFFTAMTGAMTAGLDAGLIYNTFPHMGDDYLPSQGELMSPVFARKSDLSDLWWRNLLENPTTVQLVHRIFATSTFLSIVTANFYVSKNKSIVPKSALKMMHTMVGFASLQVCLGISTLIYLVPIPLASAHQAGALALLTTGLAFVARLKKPRTQTIQFIKQSMKH